MVNSIFDDRENLIKIWIEERRSRDFSANLMWENVKNLTIFTILNSECSFAEFPNLKTEEQLRQCAKQMQDSVVHLEASIDGIPLTGLEKYRIQSPLFNFTLPENNILGLPSQTTSAVSDGNWVFLKPSLPVGNHTIYFKDGLKNVTDNISHEFAGPYGWDYPNTYHITTTAAQ
jgi:hypothetical protein